MLRDLHSNLKQNKKHKISALITTTQAPSSTHRVFRFGPFLPHLHHPALPIHHPTLPPFLAHPFDIYNNINPIPELPPQPEAKHNGYYDVDGNFVSYSDDRVCHFLRLLKKILTFRLVAMLPEKLPDPRDN